MFKNIFLIFIIFLLISTVSWADFSLVRQQNLSNKLHQLVQPYEKKVGMFFIDLKSGWQFQLNGTREYPAASVAKMAVMATAYHLADSGELDLEQQVLFTERDKLGGSGVLQWMKGGRLYTLRN